MTELESNGNVIRVTNQRGQRIYVEFALLLLRGGKDRRGEEHSKRDSIVISAMGQAIHNAVNIAEIVKRRIVGLHQITTISSEVVGEGSNDAQGDVDGKGHNSRKASIITIQLSRKPLNTKDVGYQAPLPESMVTDEEPHEDRPRNNQGAYARNGDYDGPRGGSGRGGPRGGSGRGGPRGGSGRGGPRGGSGRGGPRGGSGRGGPRGGRGTY